MKRISIVPEDWWIINGKYNTVEKDNWEKKIVMQQKTDHKHCIIKLVDGNMGGTNIETDNHNDLTWKDLDDDHVEDGFEGLELYQRTPWNNWFTNGLKRSCSSQNQV